MTNTKDEHAPDAAEQLRELEGNPSDEDIDTEQLPVWWSDAIEEFQEHDLPAYRPPRFADDVLTPPVVDRLQSEYGAEIRFMGVGVEYRDSWGVYVGDEQIFTVDREREPAGYTRYQVTSDAFEQKVRNHFTETGDEPT
ncbi:hypothetical protein ACFR99_03100 [Haloarchaeobius amylolyticus]|uniref:Uncharacterized protein n=1 Tax=Haloarchaeobius amylolyticus TaxID=1198296 RepID=A0ABD6BCQ2_9EURY